MPTVAYPPALPGPQPGSFMPRQRRAVSSIEGPLQQRPRQRDAAGLTSQYTYVYTPHQMGVWLDWYRTTLRSGRRWFEHVLPGRGGLLPRVVRYTSVQQHLLGCGLYRVSVNFEQRGAGTLSLDDSFFVHLNGATATGGPGPFHVGTTSEVGVVVSGLDGDGIYALSLPSGQIHTGWSLWPSDFAPDGPGPFASWGNQFIVTRMPGPAVGAFDSRSTIFGSPTGWPTGEAACAAFAGGSMTGASAYSFWLSDLVPLDDRGGLSILVTRVT